MIRRQDHLLLDPVVRFDFDKGALANEHRVLQEQRTAKAEVVVLKAGHTHS